MTKNLQEINQRFRKVGEFILRFRRLLIVALIVLDLVGFWGVTQMKVQSSLDSWFLEGDPLTKITDEFEEIFGNNEYVAILVEAGDVFSPGILKMMRELGKELENNVPYSDKVTSLAEFEFTRGTEDGIVTENLVPDEIPTDPQEIEKIRQLAFSKENLINRLFTDDSKQTWLTLRLKPYPDDHFDRHGEEGTITVGREVVKILNQDKYKPYTLKAAGMPVSEYEEGIFFGKEAIRTIMLALLVSFIVLVLFLRSVKGVLVPIITTVSSIVVAYGVMGILGITIDQNMVAVPVYLGLAISIGYSIHIFNFFKRRFIETGDRREAVLYSIEQAGWPLMFTALTTIGCLLSFNFVSITVVQWVGNASAAIIVIVYIFAMVLTPALLSFGKNRAPKKNDIDGHLLWTDRLLSGLGTWTLKHAKYIAIGFVIIIAVFLVGLTKVRVDMDSFKMMGLKIPYINRIYEITQSKIGSLYSYNIKIEFDEPGVVKDPEILKKFELLDAKIKALELTKRTSSILDILKDMNRTMHSDDEAYYRVPQSQELISQLLLLYEMSGGAEAEKWLDYDYTMLNLMVEVESFKAKEVESEINYIKGLAKELFPAAKTDMVGVFVQFAVIQNYVVQGQIISFLIALGVIAILMIVVFRSVTAGLIGLIPNLAPVIIVGGFMGYTGIPLDMITMTIVPMLLGISVDDSIHFVNHMKLEITQTGSYNEGILHTFKTVGKALFMTTVILVATFSMYTTSIAQFFVNMGVLVSLGLTSALLADYLITPILIRWSKPFGEEKSSEFSSRAKQANA